MKSFSYDAIGTRWIVEIADALPETAYESLEREIHHVTEEYDKSFSRFREDSLVTEMARSEGIYPLTTEGYDLLRLYRTLYELTDGVFTPLIGSVLEEAGYDREYSLQRKQLHHPPGWDEVLAFTKNTITIKQPAVLDFGAAGKGQLVDLISSLLLKQHVSEFSVDAGGDIRYHGKDMLRVGMEHPHQTEQVIGVVSVRNQSIAASAGNRRKWGSYHHIMHPKTLSPVASVLATWVIADTAMVADAIATCLFFVPASTLKSKFSFTYLTLYPDYTVEKSEDFPAELFYNK